MKTKSIQCWAVVFSGKDESIPETHKTRSSAQSASSEYNKSGYTCGVRKVKIIVIKRK